MILPIFLAFDRPVVINSIWGFHLSCHKTNGIHWVLLKIAYGGGSKGGKVNFFSIRGHEKLFSIRGREILIKTVIQAIPCYTMNCFRLSKALIHELHQMIARFWWKGLDEARRIHWVSWSDLCRPKCLDGLGFKNLELFNQSLLAKQG